MSYRVHHLNAATFCPGPQKWVEGGSGSLFRKAYLSCHCLLIESPIGLILVDTGFAVQDLTQRTLITRLQHTMQGLIADSELCLLHQIKQLGFKASDVTHIVLTHLDPDHAGGIKDFPHATVHVHAAEYAAGTQPMTATERARYQAHNWAHQPRWQQHGVFGERWEGFNAVHLLAENLPDILLVPLTGHSRGHSGVAIQSNEGWLLHCGDAYFHHQEIKANPPYCPPGAAAIQSLFESSRADRLANQSRLRELYAAQETRSAERDRVQLICSHDMSEFHACCSHHH